MATRSYMSAVANTICYYSSLKLSICCALVGIPLAWLGSHGVNFLQWWLLAIGLFLLMIFITVCQSLPNINRDVIYLHLIAMLIAIVALVCLTIAANVSINIKKVPYGPESGPTPVREHNLSDYSGRIRESLSDPQYWATIKTELRQSHACDGMSPLVRDPDTGNYIAELPSKKYPYDSGLSPIESGCCKPPLSCGFTYVNQTTWIRTDQSTIAMVTTNADCGRWSNDQQTLCFQCDSCKAGVLADIQRAWYVPVGVVMTAVVAAHVIGYPVQVWILAFK